jgi:hypothetical protein
MHQDALNLFQILVQLGASPGTDFSFDAEGGVCSLTEHSYTLLKEAYPELDWDDYVEVVERDPEEAIAAVHEHLGIDFIDRLIEQISFRLHTLPDGEAIWYLYQVLDGVEHKTGVPLYGVLQSRLGLTEQVRVERLLRQEGDAIPCGDWILDLVIAAGGHPSDVSIEFDDVLLTEEGMRRLASVWLGELNPFEELAKHAA